MKKIILSLCIGLALFSSSFAITSKVTRFLLTVDDCPQCAASTTVDGKRCILSGCIFGGGISICNYNCGSFENLAE